jgi:hypothetical protein
VVIVILSVTVPPTVTKAVLVTTVGATLVEVPIKYPPPKPTNNRTTANNAATVLEIPTRYTFFIFITIPIKLVYKDISKSSECPLKALNTL